jgi:hypothetical protein
VLNGVKNDVAFPKQDAPRQQSSQDVVGTPGVLLSHLASNMSRASVHTAWSPKARQAHSVVVATRGLKRESRPSLIAYSMRLTLPMEGCLPGQPTA